MSEPIGVTGVRSAETQALRDRRAKLFPRQRTLDDSGNPAPLGLAFSGGGIRSATFNLGVLQGLAERGLLPHIDYLSTVSGGGYIGSWLHGVIRHKHDGDPRPAATDLDPNRPPGQPESDPIAFLRKYSNYLAPRLGLFSPDFWTIESVWVRNMLLNLLILIPFLAGCVLIVVMAGLLQQIYGQEFSRNAASQIWSFAMVIAIVVVGMNLREIGHDPENFPDVPRMPNRSRFRVNWSGQPVNLAVGCVVLAVYILGAFHFPFHRVVSFPVLLAFFLLFQWIGGFLHCYKLRHRGRRGWYHMLWMPAVSAGLTAVLMRAEWLNTSGWQCPDQEWLRIAFGPPLILTTWLIGVTLHIGLIGSDFPDAAREWLATFGAKLSLVMAFWMGVFTIAVYGPYWLAILTLAYLPVGIGAAGGWILSGIGGYFSGNSEKTQSGSMASAPDRAGAVLEIVGKVAPTVFLAGFLLFVSVGTHLTLRAIAGSPAPDSTCVSPIHVKGGIPDYLEWLVPVQLEYWCELHQGQRLLAYAFGVWAVCVLVVAIVSARVNINEFSMHHFYKNRLVRCYLGAGRADRRTPNPVTGFDPEDDIPIAWLSAASGYFGPYPIVNCALNLNTGSELAQQERRGASFVFTPRYCGFDPSHSREDAAAAQDDPGLHVEGYRASEGYMYPDGPRLGSAMAISGAAANPNMGYHTSAPLAFLMTIFNVRLGWWLGNPRRDRASLNPGPKFALQSLLGELFAQTNNRSHYVNVSDGGHFDNLGLYELVRRRCPFIISCDAEADVLLHFEGLGGAIRKCRADFGVEIELDPSAIRDHQSHAAVGTIRYPEGTTGQILYIKASLTGDESADVRQYQCGHNTFPHESTADQFFTESQFESYRQLGLHAARSAFQGVATTPNEESEDAMRSMFDELRRASLHTAAQVTHA